MLASPGLKYLKQWTYIISQYTLCWHLDCVFSQKTLKNGCVHQPIQCLSSASQPVFNVQHRQLLLRKRKKATTFSSRGKPFKFPTLIQTWQNIKECKIFLTNIWFNFKKPPLFCRGTVSSFFQKYFTEIFRVWFLSSTSGLPARWCAEKYHRNIYKDFFWVQINSWALSDCFIELCGKVLAV